MTDSNRGRFGSKIGLILATAGGAVGLGNVWRFPYMAGQEGGAAFILVYIGSVLLLGIPCMISAHGCTPPTCGWLFSPSVSMPRSLASRTLP